MSKKVKAETETDTTKDSASKGPSLEALSSRLETLEKSVQQIPEVLMNAFAEYDKRVVERLKVMEVGRPQTAGVDSKPGIGGTMGLVESIVKIVGPFINRDSTATELNELSQKIALASLRSVYRQVLKNTGVVEHVIVEG